VFEWATEIARLYGTFLSYATVLVFIAIFVFKLRSKLGFTQWTRSTRKCALTLLFLVSFAFVIRLPFIWANESGWDEPYYISASLFYMEGFSEGLGSSKFIANFEHPPLVKYLLGLYLKPLFPSTHVDYGSQLPSDNLLYYSRLFNVFIGSISVVPLFLLAEKIKKGLGISSSVFFALNPSHARMSGLAYLDVPMIFFGLCSMFFTLRLLERPNWKNLLTSGIFTGLLLGTKWVQPILFIVPMALLMLIQFRMRARAKEVFCYTISLVVGFSVLIALWLPLIWRFGLNRIPDFFLWVNSYWAPQFSSTKGNSVLDMALWNMSIFELALFAFCFVIVFVFLALDIKDKKVHYACLMPIITVTVFLIAMQIEKRGALYYWTTITPFASLIFAEALCLLKDHIKVSRMSTNI